MTRRAIIFVWAALAAFSIPVHAQYKTFILGGTNYPSSTNLVLDAGVAVKALRVPGSTLLSGNTIFVPLRPGGQDFTQSAGVIQLGEIIVGPAMIRMEGGFFVDVFTFQIIPLSTQFTPSNAVLIPADAKGPVAIIMESSTNLVDWLQALPGTYGMSAQQRYFRIRAVAQ